MRRWAWQVGIALFAAALSLYLVHLVTEYYGDSPGVYEPKDFERELLMEQTGRSIAEQVDQP